MANKRFIRRAASLACLAALSFGNAQAADVARVKGPDGLWSEVPLAGVREAECRALLETFFRSRRSHTQAKDPV